MAAVFRTSERNTMKKFRFDLLFLAIAVVCFGIYGAISYHNAALAKQAGAVRARIQEEYAPVRTAQEESVYQSPYAAVFASNEDCIAWLNIPDTNIDYPVMQTMDDEEYYLYRNFFGEDDKNGTLFMDTDCDLGKERSNLIIHGHHMKSGAMFGSLEKYADADFCKAHSKIYLYTKDEVRTYEVLAAFQAKVYKNKTDKFRYYAYFGFDTAEQFDEYYDNIKRLSLYDSGVTAQFGDEILTLSTCAYHTKNGRFAVAAKRVE